ncbi:hypothetical protein GIB67_024888, partial [Kingdonia uniflora]
MNSSIINECFLRGVNGYHIVRQIYKMIILRSMILCHKKILKKPYKFNHRCHHPSFYFSPQNSTIDVIIHHFICQPNKFIRGNY